jgi:hypothetical protein
MNDLSHFPTTDIRFWQNAVFRQPYTLDGQARLTKEWYARVQYGVKWQFRRNKLLGLPIQVIDDKGSAQETEIYARLQSEGRLKITERRFLPLNHEQPHRNTLRILDSILGR